MNKLNTIIATLLLTVTTATAQIGTWRAYPSYSQVENIHEASGNTVYVQASGALYSYNTTDHSITTYDKTTVLNGSDIKLTAWCQATQKLVIVYSDGNIDLLDNKTGEVENLPDYYNKTMTEDKTVYGIDIYDTHAYISTGFGIININTANASITDTYKIGFRIDWCSIDDTNIYAHSTTNGTYSAPLTANLLDPSVWTYSSAYTAKQTSMDPDLQAVVNTLNPGGPKSNYFGYMKFENNRLYTCAGVQSEYITGTIQVLQEDEWKIYQDEGISEQTDMPYQNIYCFSIDPSDPEHMFAGARNGLYEFQSGLFKNYYDYRNSPIEIYDGVHTEAQLIFGLTYYTDRNLYILNSQAPTQALIKLSPSGEWTSLPHSELMKLNDGGYTNKSLGNMCNAFIDSRGLIWFVNNHYMLPSFYCYQPSTDALNSYVPEYNQDGTSINGSLFRCIAEDKDGNIWVGTNIGPLLLYASDITSESPVYNQVKVPRNDGTNLADYLLNSIDITAMVIDGANRKWFGTNGNGLYLISEDNMTQVEHFTTDNSPLLSDNIESLAYDGNKGMLYIGTDIGLCSYQSDATTPAESMNKDDVYAYPNPVRPDYTGPITIVGLTYNADVKITTANGVLVNQGLCNGGTFTWDGTDLKGRRVASGVYMVQTATQDGDSGTVCKIAVVN